MAIEDERKFDPPLTVGKKRVWRNFYDFEVRNPSTLNRSNEQTAVHIDQMVRQRREMLGTPFTLGS